MNQTDLQNIKNDIIGLVNAGKLADAKTMCHRFCKKNPQNAEAWFLLSAICGQQDDYKSAEIYSSKVIELNASNPSAWYNLAIAQRRLDKDELAIESHMSALQLAPEFIPSMYELGNIYLGRKDYLNAKAMYESVLNKQPEAFLVHTSIARMHFESGDIDAARRSYSTSLSINPAQPEALTGLVDVEESAGHIDSAIKNAQQAIGYGADVTEMTLRLASLYESKRDFGAAEAAYNKILSTEPSHVKAAIGLSSLYSNQHRYDDAEKVISPLIKAVDDDPYVSYTYAIALAGNKQYSEARRSYENALALKPDFIEALINTANISLLGGDVRHAYQQYSRAYELDPENHDSASNRLMSTNYLTDMDDDERLSLHLSWASDQKQRCVNDVVCSRYEHDRLRVGYVSPDYHRHSVAYFFDAIIRFTDTERFQNTCYYTSDIEDEVTRSFRSMAQQWREVATMRDADFAALIKRDEIDILVDLTGHMSGNRLGVFACRPAPVQLTYLGYPYSTGLDTIDYRVVDKITDPPGESQGIPEKRLYMEPAFLCYRSVDDAPEFDELPASGNGYVTFGSFNNLAKVNEHVIEVWCDLLKRVPESKFCLKARQFTDEKLKSDFAELFLAYGIGNDRLILLDFTASIADHLKCYGQVDITLDTFPYNGTTTTFESMYMGVPVICLKGDTHASRVGDSILTNLGRQEWLAEDVTDYVNRAAKLAADIDNLTVLRRTLRGELQQSPLMQQEEFVKRFEQMLTDAYHEDAMAK